MSSGGSVKASDRMLGLKQKFYVFQNGEEMGQKPLSVHVSYPESVDDLNLFVNGHKYL